MEEKSIVDISEAGGMGGAAEEESTESAEKAEDVAEEKQPEDESKEEEEPAPRKSRRVSEEDNAQDDEAEESEDEEEEDGEDEEGSKSKRPAKTVPYGLLKAKNAKIKELQRQLAGRAEKADESGDEGDADEVEETANALAEELGIDAKGLAKILRATQKLNGKGKFELPKDIQDKLKTLDNLQEREKIQAEEAHFDKEWSAVMPEIKKQFPNASESELSEARKLMNTLAHSKEFHKYDIDYILYKNKSKFETILKVAGKSKSGERSKAIREDNYEATDDDDNLPNIEDITPEMMKARDNKAMGRRESSPRDYKIYNPVKNL